MKKLLMLIALLTALLMLAGVAMAEETMVLDSAVQASFADDAGSYWVEIEQGNDGHFFMSAMYTAEDGSVTLWSISNDQAFDTEFDYIDAYCARVVVDAADEALSDAETVYEDGTGHIAFDGEVMIWTNTTDDWQIQLGLVDAVTLTNYVEAGDPECMLTAYQSGETGDVMLLNILRSTEEKLEYWTMTITWSDAQNAYAYTDGEYACYAMTGENAELASYENGTGTFALMEDQSLVWTSSDHNDAGNMRFVMNYIDLAE